MPEISITVFLIPFAAYLLGSIPFGLLLAKLFGGADVRKAGSGNIGATNVAPVSGPLAGILTLAFDTAKAAAAMPLLFYFLWGPRHAPPIIVNVGTLAIALLVIYKHDGNLRRLVGGTEPRFSLGKKKETE